jgi:arabinofuranosyltransferase
MASPRYGTETQATRAGDERTLPAPAWSWPQSGLPILVGLGFWAIFIARNAFRFDGRTGFSLFDDAMISMRYARNLASGYGLTWNPGEVPVEGYTNPLWTLWMAVLHRLPLSTLDVSLAVMLSGVVLLAANVAWVGAIARRLWPDEPRVAAGAMWIAALNYGLAFWTLRGMEVGLVAFLFTAAAWLALALGDASRRVSVGWLGLVFAAAVLTRWDTLAGLVPIGIYSLASNSGRRRRLVILVAGGAVVATLAAQVLFRLATYGDWLPNTYVLKVEGIEPGIRVARGALAALHSAVTFLPLVLGFSALGLAELGKREPRVAWLLAGPFVGVEVYSAFVGGDAWEFMSHPNRFVVASLPLLGVAAAGGVRALVSCPPEVRRRRAHVLAATCAVAAALALATVVGGSSALQLDVTRAHLALRVALAASTVMALVILSRWRASPNRMLAAGIALMVIGSQAEPFGRWLMRGASHAERDSAMARCGLAVRDATQPDASIAVTWAGGLSYFSERRSFDLLGKTDARVARTPPHAGGGEFRPGHEKWDLAYSIGELRPDVILGVWRPTDEERQRFVSWGYVQVGDGVFVLRTSPRVDERKVASAVELMSVMRRRSSTLAPLHPQRVDLLRKEPD